uniref:Uncharacterized protein n=2 Tax=Anguilla anguilla TaxID=7936 RepID=A0A0E9SFV1_ANGAN
METPAMACMYTVKMVFSVGLETKQSTLWGQGGRWHTYLAWTTKP